MRSIFTCFFITCSFFSIINGQSCLPNGITFTTQNQIDSFSINYPGCTEIEGNVFINSSPLITNLEGLEQLISIDGNLQIENNDSLSSLNGLNFLEFVGGNVFIEMNSSLISLDGLDSLNIIGQGLRIKYNVILEEITNLNALISIGAELVIKGNPELQSLIGLGQITSLNDECLIVENALLSDLNGLDKLRIIDDLLSIKNNEALTSLLGLDSLLALGSYLKIEGNPSLNSISALNNIDVSTISKLYINGNSNLTFCSESWVCNFINIGGEVEINDNALGCNSETQVIDGCTVPIKTIANDEYYRISTFPNPADNSITILNESGAVIEMVKIYNQLGQSVLQIQLENQTMNISQLSSGIYILEAEMKDRKVFEKLVVE